MNENDPRYKWYLECTDRCSYCFKLPRLGVKLDGSLRFYCQKHPNNHGDWNSIGLAVTSWNIVQRKIRKKI